MILPEISENNFLKEPKKIIFRFIFICLLLMNLKVCNGKLFKCEQRWHSGNGLWSNIVKKKKRWFVHLHQQLVLFIFYSCLCLQLQLAKKNNLWARRSQSWNLSPFWCCKMINATVVTRLEMILKLPTEGELWPFSVCLWAEKFGNFFCTLPPFFICHREHLSCHH